MPVYEYECKACEKVIEIQQKMADAPLTRCPDCDGPISKLMSMSSFQLKGGGWYADGYGSTKGEATKPAPEGGTTKPTPEGGATKTTPEGGTTKPTPEKPKSCKAAPSCAGCPAASTA